MAAALLVVIGMCMLMTGPGYWLYLDIIAPIVITLIDLKCGSKVSFLTAISSLCLVFLVQGSILSSVYLVQAFVYGGICGWLLKRQLSFMEDMLLGSLAGLLMALGFDRVIMVMTHVSLLEDIPAFFAGVLPMTQMQVFYYFAIASVPIVSVLMVYFGSLVMGHYLHLLNAKQCEKYKQFRYYRYLAPWIYYPAHTVMISSLVGGSFLWLGTYFDKGYVKAIFICSTTIIGYFVLQDCWKLLTSYSYSRFGKRHYAMMVQGSLLVGLCFQFKWCAVLMIGLSLGIERKTHFRQKQAKTLQWYLKHHQGLT